MQTIFDIDAVFARRTGLKVMLQLIGAVWSNAITTSGKRKVWFVKVWCGCDTAWISSSGRKGEIASSRSTVLSRKHCATCAHRVATNSTFRQYALEEKRTAYSVFSNQFVVYKN